MKVELENQIAALQAKRDQLQQELAAQTAQIDSEIAVLADKMTKLVNEIPPEFHNLTQDIFDKLKEYFN